MALADVAFETRQKIKNLIILFIHQLQLEYNNNFWKKKINRFDSRHVTSVILAGRWLWLTLLWAHGRKLKHLWSEIEACNSGRSEWGGWMEADWMNEHFKCDCWDNGGFSIEFNAVNSPSEKLDVKGLLLLLLLLLLPEMSAVADDRFLWTINFIDLFKSFSTCETAHSDPFRPICHQRSNTVEFE